MTVSQRVIIGVGNEFRQDDGAGIAVARRLRQAFIPGAEIVESSGEGVELLQILCEWQNVAIVDAVSSGQPAGTVHHLDAARETIPHGLWRSSSHLFGVAEAIEMARVFGRLPPTCRVYGIEGRSFQYGTALSDEVAAAIDQVVDELSAPVKMDG